MKIQKMCENKICRSSNYRPYRYLYPPTANPVDHAHVCTFTLLHCVIICSGMYYAIVEVEGCGCLFGRWMQVLSWNMNRAAFWKQSPSTFSTCGPSMFLAFKVTVLTTEKNTHTHNEQEINREDTSN